MPIPFYWIAMIKITTVFRRGGSVGWGTALQAGRSRGRLPMVSLQFFWPHYGPGVDSHYGPGVDSASNRNEHQEYFLLVKAAGA